MEKKKEIKPIDIRKIVKSLWSNRRRYYVVLPATLILTYLFLLFIPRYYRCSVSLAPEPTGVSVSGSLSSLASSFGLGSSLGKMASQDAIYSDIYPDVIQSKNFIAELMPVEVSTKKGDVKCSYYTYLRDKRSVAWWDWVKGAVSELIKPTPKDTYNGETALKVFDLTKQQEDLFSAVQNNIQCTVDKKTDIVTITVTDQDPKVCALIADSTCQKLQKFIVNYRTHKARIDYEYYKKLCQDSKVEYEKALRKYATNSDANRNAILATYQAKIESLENEMQARFNVYTAMNTQMQTAEAKLQEATPAFTVIESASIPTKPAGPKRMIISFCMMLLAFFVITGRILVREY